MSSMIQMVKLQSKSGNRASSEVTTKMLVELLANRGMPNLEIIRFTERLEENKPIDGATIYRDFADIIFSPYVISEAQHTLNNKDIIT